MDIGKLKEYSNLAQDIALTKKNALEKCKSRQIFAYNNRLFRADAQTITLINTLKSHTNTFVILDVNENPCQIEDPETFLKILLQKNQETINGYQQVLDKFKQK